MTATLHHEPVIRRIDIAGSHPAFEGHFPGRPILPGVVLVAEVIEAALAEPDLASCLGARPQLAVVKFLAPVLPGARLAVRFRRSATGLEFSVDDDDGRLAASGRFANATPDGATP